MRLDQAIGRYRSFQEARGDAECHRKECARILEAFRKRAGDCLLGEVTPDELQGFLAEVRSRPGTRGRERVSDLTVTAYHRTLGAFFGWAEREGLVEKSPMARVPRPKAATVLVRPFSEEQVKKLLAQPDPTTFAGLRDLALMCFLLDTGCRISEALSLELPHLDLGRRIARVLGKGRREREVPFGRCAEDWLRGYLDRRLASEATAYVFTNEYGERLTRHAATRRIGAYGRQAGLRGVRASAHTFRHTFSVNWLLGDGEYKGDALSLQRILGHSSPAMTQRYVHLTGQDLARLHERLSPADRLVPRPPQPGRRRRL